MSERASAYVGRRVPCREDLRRLTGGSHFGADFEGQLHARMVRNDTPHGSIVRVDKSAAEAIPGVVGVFVAADVPDVRIPVRLFPTDRSEATLQAPLARERVEIDPLDVVLDPLEPGEGSHVLTGGTVALVRVADPRRRRPGDRTRAARLQRRGRRPRSDGRRACGLPITPDKVRPLARRRFQATTATTRMR